MTSTGLSLPSINRAVSDNSILYGHGVSVQAVEPVADGDAVKKFGQKLDMMASLNYPIFDPQSSVKARLLTLETGGSTQATYNKCNELALQHLERHVENNDANIKSLILSMQSDFDQRLLSLQKEYDHRFVTESLHSISFTFLVF